MSTSSASLFDGAGAGAMPSTPIPVVVMSQAKAKQKALFKSAIRYCLYLFPNGKPAHFIDHRFATDVVSEIEHLENEIAGGHTMLSVDLNERVVESYEDPIAGLRAKILAEVKAEMAAATNPENQMGNSQQGPLNMATSASIVDMASGSAGKASGVSTVPTIRVK
jgi:hypothetical protein